MYRSHNLVFSLTAILHVFSITHKHSTHYRRLWYAADIAGANGADYLVPVGPGFGRGGIPLLGDVHPKLGN